MVIRSPEGTATVDEEYAMATVESTRFAAPGSPDSPVQLKDRYENFIGGEWLAPTTGEYRENLTPVSAEPFCRIA